MSEPKGVTCEVPQCSILGPLLFLLYVNDMASAVRCKLLLYADDSGLIASGKNIADIETTLSSDLEFVYLHRFIQNIGRHTVTTGESDIFSVAQKPDQCVDRKHFRRARLGFTHKQFDPCAALDVAFSTGKERCGCCLCRQ